MKNLALIILLGLALVGCKVGPKYEKPEMQQPPKYTQAATSTDSITNLAWWEVYQDETLKGLIQTALDSNLNLLQAAARVEEAKATLGFNKANLYPMLNYNALGRAANFRDFAQDAGVAFSPNMLAVLGNVSWEIDFWGKLRRANRAAFAEMMAAEEARKTVYISLVAQVAELYFNLRGLDERLAITKRTHEIRLEYLDIISKRFEKGNVSELDKLQAQQIAAAAESQIYALERQIIYVENALNVLLARPYRPIERGKENQDQALPLDIPVGLPSELLVRRPDIQAAEQRLMAQTERIGIAVAMRFPSISLTGMMGVASPSLSNLFTPEAVLGTVTGQLTGPIFNFGKNKRRVDVERARAVQSAYEYEKTVLTAFAEVENSLAEIRTYRNEFNARRVQKAATEKSLFLSKALYDNGYTSFLQVLDAERESFNAEFEKSVALENQLVATVRLYKALGGGW
ncbi:efflux transporter outer membrane subunit [Mariniradius sediminis]|uniref:Efflux transporter outer membrane subunit n=1 Tax=Mariniradius sediminis TaxID=2909237 RepID=A0ABS9BXY7_9BACT|nr:efflux transporter outer membrane subunit [Mariniradius sediminis]MCF1752927.1 efflux transporter outer membrane subunit [Mariniradius sediminis]